MVQRVTVVDGNQVAAENITSFIMGTKIGMGALCYGLYWLLGYFSQDLFSGGLFYVNLFIVPAAIILSAFLLLIVFACAISFEDVLIQIALSCGISYLAMTTILQMGWIGRSEGEPIIGIIALFSAILFAFRMVMKHPKVLIGAKILGGIIIFFELSSPFITTAFQILRAAGWA